MVTQLHFICQSAPAQNTVITDQGRLSAYGTNSTDFGRFKFALVTCTNLARTAVSLAAAKAGSL